MVDIDLRDYQEAGLQGLRESFASGHKRPILVSPCGSGKTHLAAKIMQSVKENGKRGMFTAPRRELVFQTSKRLAGFKIPHGIIMSGEKRQRMRDVHVASMDTLISRGDPPEVDVLIIDECHLSISDKRLELIEGFVEQGCLVIGLTATPVRTDGKGMGRIYDDLVMGPTIRDLTPEHLVPMRYFAPTKVDLAGIGVVAGDYNAKQLGQRMDDAKLIGDVVENWKRIAGERKTVVFSVNVAHSRHLCDEFKRAGVTAEHIDAKTRAPERREILDRVESGETQVITNCDILSLGWDHPPISCAVLARPTKSIARYLQAAGRVLRPYPGKVDSLLIDHTGTVETLGFVDDDFPWSLDDGNIKDRMEAASKETKEPKNITCPECATIFSGTAICPNCGADLSTQRREAIAHIEAELEEVTSKNKPKLEAIPRHDVYAQLLWHGKEKGYKENWAAVQYKERFKTWPDKRDTVPQRPGPEVLGWIKHRQIARAYGRKKSAQRALQERLV